MHVPLIELVGAEVPQVDVREHAASELVQVGPDQLRQRVEDRRHRREENRRYAVGPPLCANAAFSLSLTRANTHTSTQARTIAGMRITMCSHTHTHTLS